MEPCPELTQRLEHIDVVTAHEVLREVYDGPHEGGLAVMIRGYLGDGPRQLGDLLLRGDVTLQAGEHHFTLTRLEP